MLTVIIGFAIADFAHPVERHLAKVKVASSSLVIRSTLIENTFDVFSINELNATPKNGIYPLSTAKNTGISLFINFLPFFVCILFF